MREMISLKFAINTHFNEAVPNKAMNALRTGRPNGMPAESGLMKLQNFIYSPNN